MRDGLPLNQRLFQTRIVFLCLLLLGIGGSRATGAEPEGRPQVEAAIPRIGPRPATAEDVPVAVPQPSPLAVQYHQSGDRLWVLGELWALVIPALWLFTGASARLRSLAQRIGRKWFLVVGIYAVAYIALNFVIDLPLSYYWGFVRSHAYGLSVQTLGHWVGNHLKSLAVSMLVTFFVLWIPYLLLKRSPRRWWLYTGLLSVPFMLVGMLVVPIWYDPLFNDFGPMKNKVLEQKIRALAEKAGIEGSRIFEVDKSRDTKTINAYVSGFMGTKRIVLWDTLLDRLSDEEILFILGHEMGHYVLNHVVRSILLLSVLNLFSLYIVYRVAGRLIARFHVRFGFDHLSDVASVPLLALLLQLVSLGVTPLAWAYSRHQEHEADRFALELTRANHAGASAFVKLQERNLGVPWPGWLYRIWRATHPSIAERVEFCNQYHPWRTGAPLIYGSYIHDASRSHASSPQMPSDARSRSGSFSEALNSSSRIVRSTSNHDLSAHSL